MKKVILIGLLAAVPFGRGFAGEREELMARMGFSKEEISKDAVAHNALTGKLDANGGKSDPKVGELERRETDEINELRALNTLRQQAENLAGETRHRAVVARAEQLDAEARAQVALNETNAVTDVLGVSALIRGQAWDRYYPVRDAAKEARATAEAEARTAQETRAEADATIAKVKAAEARLAIQQQARAEKNRLARAEKERLVRESK